MITVKSLIALVVMAALSTGVVLHAPGSTLARDEHLVNQARVDVSAAHAESAHAPETAETSWAAKVSSALASFDPAAVFATFMSETDVRYEGSVDVESVLQLDTGAAVLDSSAAVDLSHRPDVSRTIETEAGSAAETDVAVKGGANASAGVDVETGADIGLETGAGDLDVEAGLDAEIGTGLNISLGR